MHRVVVEVAAEDGAVMLRRPLVAEIDLDARVGRHLVAMVHDARQQLVGVGKHRLAALPHVNAAGGHVEHVVNHARAEKRVARAVEVHAPRIARAIRIDLELPRLDVVARDGGVHANAGRGRVLRVLHIRAREDAVGHVELAVGAPGEAVEQLVAVLQPEAGEQRRLLVRLLKRADARARRGVRVLQEEDVRCLTEEHAAVPEQNARRQTKAVSEDRDLVRAPVAVGVLENLDAVAALLARFRAERILVKLDHPQPPALVPRHRDGVHDLRLAGEEADFKPRRQRELGLRRFR